MNLSPETQAAIDAMSVEDLLRRRRFAPIGDTFYHGESGDYATKRLAELRSADPEAYTAASKRVGWER